MAGQSICGQKCYGRSHIKVLVTLFWSSDACVSGSRRSRWWSPESVTYWGGPVGLVWRRGSHEDGCIGVEFSNPVRKVKGGFVVVLSRYQVGSQLVGKPQEVGRSMLASILI